MQDANYQGAVNCGCLLWMPPLTVPEYRDVMSSLLYVQLAANKKHSAFTAAAKWHEVLRGALQQFGWAPLKISYGDRPAQQDFRLVDFIKAPDLPLTDRLRQAGAALCAHMAASPASDKALQVLQRNIVKAIGADVVDGGSCERDEPGQIRDDLLTPNTVEPAISITGKGIKGQMYSGPQTAVAVHFGAALPGRQIELLSVHFTFRGRADANIFNQQFSRENVVGNILTKTFVGQLSEPQYALFRTRLSDLLQTRWPNEVVEDLPIKEARP